MNTLIVSFDETKYKFNLYNHHGNYIGTSDKHNLYEHQNNNSRNYIGSFDIYQLIKYITQNVPKYLEDVECSTCDSIIEKYICKIDTETNLITLQNHIESQFMGDINSILKLYKCVNDFIINKFENELRKSLCNPEESKLVSMCIKQFLFMLLCHSLKIIAQIIEVISNDPEKQMLRFQLMEYSIGIMNKINTFMKIEFKKKTDELFKLIELSKKTTSIKISLAEKMDKLNNNILKQNNKIEKLLNEINKIKSGDTKQNSPISEYLFLPDTDK
jgi:hypothetical protein